MDLCKLFLLQLIAQILADFIFQTDLWTRHKRRYGFRSKILFWHVSIVFILSYCLSFQWNFILFSLIISLVHLVVDGFKFGIGDFQICRIKPFKKIIFFVDQFIHIGTLAISVLIFNCLLDINPYVSIQITNHHLLIILGYLVCLKPANILIREIFSIYNIKIINKPKEDLLNAGKLIGNIERVLALTLLLIGQYEAIGFIIAGKSILRYEGEKSSKTEYVLIGTLLSFGIAIIIGIIIFKLPV